jgi:hypothetical protein
VKPSVWTFFARGSQQLRKHGPRLLWLRYVRRRAILRTPPLLCPDTATLEVHTQVCARDWLNALWTLKSFSLVTGEPFKLLILCDRTVPENAILRMLAHFPEACVIRCEQPSEETRQTFAPRWPGLFALRTNERFFTLPKIMDSFAHRQSDMILTIDPDVLFFEDPKELRADLDLARPYFARLNQPLNDFDPKGAFSIDATRVRELFGLELPRRFGCGLGSLHYGKIDWDFIERVLAAVPPDPERGFLLDQTITLLVSLTQGWELLPPERYAIEPVASLVGVVARHYYSKTRDLLYLEGIPRLIELGLLKKDFRFSSQPAISAG